MVLIIILCIGVDVCAVCLFGSDSLLTTLKEAAAHSAYVKFAKCLCT